MMLAVSKTSAQKSRKSDTPQKVKEMEKLKNQEKKMEPRSSSPLTKETLDHSAKLDKATLKVMEEELTHELLTAILESLIKQPFPSPGNPVALKDPRLKLSFDMDSDVCAPIASHVTPLIQKFTADKMLAVSAVQSVTAIVVAAVTYKTRAMVVFDSLQPKPSFLRYK